MTGKLFILMGTPGSGKSTWASQHMNKDTDIIISRDTVRFSMVAEDEEYFSKEKAVFKEFLAQINTALENGTNVFADATHLNKASRNKLLRGITVTPAETSVVWVKTPVSQCITQNSNREGTRAFVPLSVIRRMNNQIETPEFEEGLDKIYIIEPNKPIIIKEKGD
jgi:predicted kinase